MGMATITYGDCTVATTDGYAISITATPTSTGWTLVINSDVQPVQPPELALEEKQEEPEPVIVSWERPRSHQKNSSPSRSAWTKNSRAKGPRGPPRSYCSTHYAYFGKSSRRTWVCRFFMRTSWARCPQLQLL